MQRITIPAEEVAVGDVLIPERSTVVDVWVDGSEVITYRTTGAPVYVGRRSMQEVAR